MVLVAKEKENMQSPTSLTQLLLWDLKVSSEGGKERTGKEMYVFL